MGRSRREIKEYLDALDLTVDIDIQTLPVGREKNYKTVFTQPGMRYSQAKKLVQSLLEDGEFQELSIDERNAVIERILSDINATCEIYEVKHSKEQACTYKKAVSA